MTAPPTTRSSLIARLVNVEDDEAWRDFTSLYEPLIYQQARHRGLQHADASELVQEVLIAVSQAIERFHVDPRRGRFRTWLYAIGRNISIRHLKRRQVTERASGDSRIRMALAETPDPRSVESQEFDLELKRQAFAWVARDVRRNTQPKTWQAFWKTTVENHSIQHTAKALQMSVGAVYIARSRVMARLRQQVEEITMDGIVEALEVIERTTPEEDVA